MRIRFIFLKSIFILVFLILSLYGCENKASSFNKDIIQFDTATFDVVEKKILIDAEIPFHVNGLIQNWFNNYVKIDGFQGKMFFSVIDYNENITEIVNGKRVDISLKYKILLDKDLVSKSQNYNGEVSSYATLTGNFSLSDFDNLIRDTQSNLIILLSEELSK